MSYLDEHGLARYDGLIKQWVTLKSGTVDGVDPLLNWQKTEAAGAVTCYPLPAAPIDPVVNFAFTETPPASGEKAPDNPSTITGVSSVKVTRCGKNQIKMPYLSQGTGSVTIRGVTFTTDESTGIVTVNGTATGGDSSFWLVGNTAFMRLRKNETYFLSGCPSGGSADTYLLTFTRYNLDDSYDASLPSDIGSGSSASYTEDWKPIIAIRVKSDVTVSNLVFKPQLELGSSATSFEPYAGTDYTIDLGGTYYGGSVDLSTGIMTVTHYGYAFTGTEAGWWERTELENTVRFGAYGSSWGSIVQATKNHNTPVCSHFTLNYSYSSDTPHFYVGDTGNQYYFYPDHTLSRDDWKAWLAQQYAAGHPLTTSLELATPYNVQLTPTQIYSLSQLDPYVPRLNTVYSDQTSVQVGYPKSPLATSIELTNAIISLGGNV